MTGGIFRGVVVPHAPRMGLPEIVPDFQKELVQGMLDLGRDIRADRPDVMIVNSAHYISTFNWHASTVAEHKGVCVAMEAPDLIPGEPYRYPGDPALGRAILEEIRGLGYPCVEAASEHYSWDYGTWVPVHYLDPDAEIAVVPIPTVLAADLEETYAVGQALDRACRAAGRRGVLVASTSLSHKLVRGPEQWPTPERQEADRRFIETLLAGRIGEAWETFPEYASFVVGEMGGRSLALLLGGLAATGAERFEAAQFGPYAQSSGSGNANLSLKVAA